VPASTPCISGNLWTSLKISTHPFINIGRSQSGCPSLGWRGWGLYWKYSQINNVRLYLDVPTKISQNLYASTPNVGRACEHPLPPSQIPQIPSQIPQGAPSLLPAPPPLSPPNIPPRGGADTGPGTGFRGYGREKKTVGIGGEGRGAHGRMGADGERCRKKKFGWESGPGRGVHTKGCRRRSRDGFENEIFERESGPGRGVHTDGCGRRSRDGCGADLCISRMDFWMWGNEVPKRNEL
jgi:hypothetical protein